eukprot:m.216687 g.216687  ORF g.216687 m.216687 type:complete len:164 (+) comp18657_c0_seq4:1848-2339(+)
MVHMSCANGPLSCSFATHVGYSQRTPPVDRTTPQTYRSTQRQTLHDHGQFLQVPELTRQFLISPPASPPVGWEPCAEDPPVFNQELVDALAGLERFQPYELVPAEGSKPAICVCDYSDAPKPAAVTIADDDDDGDFGSDVMGGLARPQEIPQTRMPPRPSHLQ